MKVVKDYPNVNFFPPIFGFLEERKEKGKKGKRRKRKGRVMHF